MIHLKMILYTIIAALNQLLTSVAIFFNHSIGFTGEKIDKETLTVAIQLNQRLIIEFSRVTW